MEFCEFVQVIKEEVEELCGDGTELMIHEIQGNNGTVQTGIGIKKEGASEAAVVSLNDYYRRCMEGELTASSAAEEICQAAAAYEIPVLQGLALESFETVKDRIVYQLADRSRNRKLLEDIPHIPYCNLEIIFYLLLETEGGGLMTALIRNCHMAGWETDADTLYWLAGENTPRLLPLSINSLGEFVKEISRKTPEDDYNAAVFENLPGKKYKSPLYVMTNREGIRGAAAVLYKGALKSFAKKRGSDLIILPSSVHEVLLLPYTDGTDFRQLKDMVECVNRTEVSEEEVLSDHVYLYSRKEDKVSLAC